MANLELTFATHEHEWDAFIQNNLDAFSHEHHVGITSRALSWTAIWKELIDISVHRSGADASEVGSTWVASLASMNSLRPFRPADVNACGGVNAFLPGAWQSALVWGSQQVWAMPFMTDVRVIYYWPDLLEKAGVDESTAFQSLDAMRHTLERLKRVVPTPLLLQTTPESHGSVYQFAAWLWSAGSDFVSEDGKSTLLETPESRQALREHFELVRYLPKDVGLIDMLAWKDVFMRRSAAVAVSGPWFVTELFRPTPLPEHLKGLGVARFPGPAFVGGSCLVVWNHSYQETSLIELLKHLLSSEVQLGVSASTGNLPANREAANTMIATGRPQIRIFIDALTNGRPLPAIPLWGLTEQRLTETFGRIWGELCEASEPDVLAVLNKRLPPLVRRLNVILAG